MAEICPVCNEEIISQYREVYKISKDSEGIVLHSYCLDKYVFKPEAQIKAESKYKERVQKDIEKREELQQKIKDKSVYVKGFSMPFGEMVIFMVKWAIASIPAFIILTIIGAILVAIFGSLFFFGCLAFLT